jgi:predicted outer membrane repeat protein
MSFSSWLRNRKSSRGLRCQGPRFHPRLEALEDRWMPSTLTVTSPLDDGSGGTLRATIAAAASGDTIVFANSLSGQTITLNGNELIINKNLNIQGPAGTTQLAISGNHLSRVFDVPSPPTGSIVFPQVSLSGLTIEYGNAGTGYAFGGAIDNGGTLSLSVCNFSDNLSIGQGGAIDSFGSLKLDGCNFSGNSAGGDGGAIYGTTPITATNHCVFSNNQSGGSGGAIYHGGGLLSLTDCNFLGNTAWNGPGGGAIFDIGGVAGVLSLSLSGCTLSGNSAHSQNPNYYAYGGAILIDGADTMLTGCTLSKNSADFGGAIYQSGESTTLIGCTITSNTATFKGGGIYNDVNSTLTLYSSTVVSGNSAPDGADIYNLGRIFKKKG